LCQARAAIRFGLGLGAFPLPVHLFALLGHGAGYAVPLS
jgi:hypothetical protein